MAEANVQHQPDERTQPTQKRGTAQPRPPSFFRAVRQVLLPTGALARRVQWEVAKLVVFYTAAYLGLVCVAIGGRLVSYGAPLLDVLAFLPLQLAFPAAIALPLAFVTACIAVVGRMHEDGELIALAAGGISPARITWLCMPVMLVTLATVGYIAHTIMPEAYLRTRQEQAALVQRALAAKINRQEPLYNKDGLTILAGGATDNSLKDVVIWQTNADGDFVALTTAAWWRAQTLPGATSIQLLLEQSDFLYQDADDGSMVSGQVNGLTYEDIRQLPDLGDKPDGQNAAVLHENLTLLTAMRRAVGEPDFPQSSWQNQRTALLAAALTAAKPAPTHLQWSDLSRPQQLLSDLASTSTDPAFLAQCRVALPKLALQQLRAQSLAESSTNRALQNTILKTLEGQRAQAPIPAWLTKANDVSDRDDITSWIALEQAVPLTTAALPVAQVVNDWRYRVARLREQQPEARLASINKRLQRELRANQFAWHMRWGMTFGVVVYWLFGCGIALQLGKANRMIAVGLGIAVVVATLVPAMVAVKGLRGNLAISPGYVLWVPLTLIALYSFRLQRRYR